MCCGQRRSRSFDQGARRLAGPHDQERPVGHGVDHGGIRERNGRGRVDDDAVEAPPQLREDAHQVVGLEQLERVVRRGAGRENGQVGRLHLDQDVIERGVSRQDIRQAEGRGRDDVARERRASEVGVDEQRAAIAILGERKGEIDRGRRLAFFGHGARDNHDLAGRPVRPGLIQLQAQTAVTLGDGRTRTVRKDEMRIVGELARDDPAQGNTCDERDSLVAGQLRLGL